ncbi:hypothetical protein ACVWXN_006742 [Bradyrhizobium sp. i1.4.4]
MKLGKRNSRSSVARTVLVGRASCGNWVAREENGLFGGLFVNRVQALKYAMLENGNHPEAIVEVWREIELDILWSEDCKRAVLYDASAQLKEIDGLNLAVRQREGDH